MGIFHVETSTRYLRFENTEFWINRGKVWGAQVGTCYDFEQPQNFILCRILLFNF